MTRPLALAAGLTLLAAASASAGGPAFVGAARCAGCHPGEAAAYRRSDHARAMLPATDAAVLGDFRRARFSQRGLVSTFFRRDGGFYVRTEGPDGKLGDFAVAYTFGVRPLQQYLVPFPDGRLQTLGIAWDTRPRREGGQRWFAVYPRERFVPGDPLHWTGREQTWNFQCAECHSTDLRKNYQPVTDRYATTWAEVTVACEACHGPGSAHVAWAETRPAGAPWAGAETTGLVVRLGRPAGRWAVRNTRGGTAEWQGDPRTAAEVDACARCHARRRGIVDPYLYGRPFLDTHVPALLQDGLYHADGQILGEVYEYGSFAQSRMFRAGVTCSDCHDPHGLGLRAPGNAICAACHSPARFDRPAHHRHRPGSAAARCVGCHMPARSYMVVDPRRDHAFPIPRPDLSVALGTPNACTGCHRDRPARWAAARVAAWYGPNASRRPHFGTALHAGRRGLAGAEAALAALATDGRQPAIARATALALLPDYLGPRSFRAVETAVADADPLVRAAGLGVVETLAVERRPLLAAPRLGDPVRAVRLAAARALVGIRAALGPNEQAAFEGALAELFASERLDADRPEAHVNLATLYERLGRPGDAEASLETALRLDPRFVPALLALAELRRAVGRDADGAQLLEQAVAAAPASAAALEALGRLRLRQARRAEGLRLLRRATALRPDAARFAYVYALALHAAGNRTGAIAVLERAHGRWPGHRDVLAALAAAHRDAGNSGAALRYAERLAALTPEDGEVQALVETLRRQSGPR